MLLRWPHGGAQECASEGVEAKDAFVLQGQRMAGVKKLFQKMGLGKKEKVRVTTPAAAAHTIQGSAEQDWPGL